MRGVGRGRPGGKAALASKGPGGNVCRLSADQLAWELERGPAVHGWSDQRWTLPRIAVVIRELFRVSYTARGVACLLRGRGWSPQVAVHRAAARDEEQITAWRGWRWSALKGPRRAWDAWIVFCDGSGQSLGSGKA
ncbi:winged helix-turn-helix domain-containing protein [Streptosporangium canum]|uniref:helix-turn-helix domain-containing protein n=1 Tax=Streptosporangium canum TaxID=324952 RepID=UPI0033A1603A